MAGREQVNKGPQNTPRSDAGCFAVNPERGNTCGRTVEVRKETAELFLPAKLSRISTKKAVPEMLFLPGHISSQLLCDFSSISGVLDLNHYMTIRSGTKI